MAEAGSLVQYARQDLLAQIGRSRNRVWLVSPFLSGGVADLIIKAAKASGTEDLRLLTALTERSVRSRVLDPKGLRRLREAGFAVASARDLHAKVSVVDRWGLVGSGNLTNSGMSEEEQKKANVELGVILTRTQVTRAAELVRHWWKAAEVKSLAEIAEYEGLKPYPIPESDLDKGNRSIGVFGTENLKELLDEGLGSVPGRTFWLDPNYHDYADEGWWRRRGWISDRRDVGIKENDLIVLYLAARDGGPARCPAVVRALGSQREDPEFVRKERDVEAVDRWPWVTDIEVVGDVPADDGVKLDVIGKTGQSLQGGPIKITQDSFEKLAGGLIS